MDQGYESLYEADLIHASIRAKRRVKPDESILEDELVVESLRLKLKNQSKKERKEQRLQNKMDQL